MKQDDKKYLALFNRRESQIKKEFLPIINKINNINAIIGSINESASTNNFDILSKIKEIEKILGSARIECMKKQRKYNIFLETKSLILKKLYSKYSYKEVETELHNLSTNKIINTE